MELTQKDVDFVKKFGTAVKSGTERYVLELKGLEKPMDFENPKDAGTEWGAQHLKGDGKDILLLNGVSAEQVKKLDPNFYMQNPAVFAQTTAELEKLKAEKDEKESLWLEIADSI